jgi:PIN domain nuclease of toxin-antitoxin system
LKVLLDTHTLLWWLSDDDRLGASARELIGDPGNDILVSVASLWEIVVKVRIGKLTADVREIADAVAREGFILLNIGTTNLLALEGLPTFHPFDHLIQHKSECNASKLNHLVVAHGSLRRPVWIS